MSDTDANCSTDPESVESETISMADVSTRGKRKLVSVSEGKDDQNYAMDKPKRGKIVIFNHYTFDESIGLAARSRAGSDVDKENLVKVFLGLGFDVLVNDDCTKKEIETCIKELASSDHEDEDCLVIVVLTYGDAKGKLYAKDGSYFLDELWKPFNAHDCPSLAGKPKIFIVESCRGVKVDQGVDICCDGGGSSRRMLEQRYSIPTECDFLIAQSSFEEFVSYRDEKCGAIFISNLCDMIEKHGKNLHLLKMLTKTARKVMYSDGVQAPCFVSNLTRDVYF